MLDLYAHAPTEAAALKLVSASVTTLRDKLQARGSFGLEVVRLGDGGRPVASAGQSMTHALETFIAVFALGMALTITIDRMRGLRPVRRHAREVAS
jgi:hypothetical protein